jgi:hypothetical protein
MGTMGRFFASLPWYDLVPDQVHALVTAGFGTPTESGLVADSDYAPAAMTGDRGLAVIYLPFPRAITVDMARFSGPVTARWFDPTNGEYADAASALLPNSGSRRFEPQRPNGEGQGDWVLVLATQGADGTQGA